MKHNKHIEEITEVVKTEVTVYRCTKCGTVYPDLKDCEHHVQQCDSTIKDKMKSAMGKVVTYKSDYSGTTYTYVGIPVRFDEHRIELACKGASASVYGMDLEDYFMICTEQDFRIVDEQTAMIILQDCAMDILEGYMERMKNQPDEMGW